MKYQNTTNLKLANTSMDRSNFFKMYHYSSRCCIKIKPVTSMNTSCLNNLSLSIFSKINTTSWFCIWNNTTKVSLIPVTLTFILLGNKNINFLCTTIDKRNVLSFVTHKTSWKCITDIKFPNYQIPIRCTSLNFKLKFNYITKTQIWKGNIFVFSKCFLITNYWPVYLSYSMFTVCIAMCQFIRHNLLRRNVASTVSLSQFMLYVKQRPVWIHVIKTLFPWVCFQNITTARLKVLLIQI